MESKRFAFRCGNTLYYCTEDNEGKTIVYTLAMTKHTGILALVMSQETRTLNSIPPRKYWEILPQFKFGWFWREAKLGLSPILYDWEQTSECSRSNIVKTLDDYLMEVNSRMDVGKLFTVIDGFGMVYNKGERVQFDRFSKVLEGLL